MMKPREPAFSTKMFNIWEERWIISDVCSVLKLPFMCGQGQEQAERFVRDFVITQLIEKDINELWHIVNPMGLLKAMLSLSGKGEPEPR